MNDINTQNPNMSGEPNRRLKKVKRPVKRLVPQGQGMPVSPRLQGQPQNPNPQEIDAFNLDSFINEDANLPAVSSREDYFNDGGSYSQPQRAPQQQVRFIEEEDLINEQPQSAGMFGSDMIAKKIAIAIGVGAFLIGMIATKLMFSEQKIVRDGLQGVVVNAEVPRGRARCGVAEKTQGCVLYIMNPQRQELSASDFYDLASQLTGRQRFVIETGNMRYSNTKIKPGEIAQFNIPPLQ